jgi:hypothetical protein
MTTVLAPLNQAIQPYVFRGGGGNNKDNIKNVSPNSIIRLKSSNSASTKIVSEGGLEMIYEETVEPFHQDSTYNSHIRQNCMTGNVNNTDLCTSLSPSPSILRRSRSLPQEEFGNLGEKLCDLERHDSIRSGKSGR